MIIIVESHIVPRYARTAFLTSPNFLWLLRRWRQGRNRVHNKGISTLGARKALDAWSVENVNLLINEEMRALDPVMRAPTKGLTEEKLLSTNLVDLETTISAKAPTLWNVLHHASSTPKQAERNTYKTHSAVSAVITLRFFDPVLIQLTAYYYDDEHVLVRKVATALPSAAAEQRILQGDRTVR